MSKFEREGYVSLGTLPPSFQSVTMANLSFNLSADDALLFQGLQASCLLPTLAHPGEGELVKLFKEKKKAEEKELIAPYADLLETEILQELGARKETILKKLKESEGSSFTVELLSWNTVYYRESLQDLKRRESEMTLTELREHRWAKHEQGRLFESNGWQSKFGTCVRTVDEDGEGMSHYGYLPVKVDRIFRHSDLALRVSLALGPNFFPFLRYARVEEFPMDDPHGYCVTKTTLCVRYYPFGVSKSQMTRLLDVVKAKSARSAEGRIATLGATTETIIGEGVTYSFSPDPVRLLGGADPRLAIRSPAERHCFCGCEDDE